MSKRVKIAAKKPEAKRGTSFSKTRENDFSQSPNSPIDFVPSKEIGKRWSFDIREDKVRLKENKIL